MVQTPVQNHVQRGNPQHYARMKNPKPHRHVVLTTVLTRSRLIPLNAARTINTVVPQTKVQHQRPTKHGVNKVNAVEGVKGNWAEAVNTAWYVQNRVLVTKPYNKTPYELLLGRTPSIGFMRPFGCPVTILNTLDPLGKFDGKANEGFLVGYSVSSKAFRVFNSRTRIVQETLHINFLENQPNVAGSEPTWLFDIDTLTQSMNYQPVVARNQPNFSTVKEPESEVYVSPSSSAKTKKHDDKTKREAKGKSLVDLSIGVRNLSEEFKDFSNNSINEINAATLEDITYSDDEEDVGAEADFSNLETNITVSPIPTTRVHKDHHVTQIIGDLSLAPQTRSMTRIVKEQGGLTQIKNDDFYTCMFSCFLSQEEPRREEGIDYEEVFAPVARIEAIRLFLAYASFMGFMVYQMDVKSAFLYGTIEEEVYVCQPPGFKDPDYPDKVYKLVKSLYGLHQAPRAWYETLANYLLENGLQLKQKQDGIFISQDKYVAEILRKFGLTDGKLGSILIDTKKPLLKDPDGEDVDVHTYRSMIGSLMYLTSSRPDIMFAVCACARFQVTPKASHLHAVKRIFRYLKGKPHLGLWYPKDSPFNMVVYSDSDYAGASLDRKSTKGAAVSCCAQVLWIQNQFLDYGRMHLNRRRGKIVKLDEDEDVTLEEVVAEVAKDADVQGRLEESQAQVYHLDLEHAQKVLSMYDDKAEPAELKEVIEVVTTAKLMTEVVTAAATTITAALMPKANAARRRKGVVIRDPKETATPSVIVHYEPKSMDKGKGILVEDPKPLKKQADRTG
uniref:Retrovirus-related Pol polyprotein from transposon TNT 1-94 n=1 Tax=Tanacetum cinerariifolium TaxID=118510 RepID=A0A699HF62_TANCI|nr:retrovirus-related Pol polyprotein from transposon TNT 1-94 [Tanacetum cinerariifolium]